jgi:hypothetical protein
MTGKAPMDEGNDAKRIETNKGSQRRHSIGSSTTFLNEFMICLDAPKVSFFAVDRQAALVSPGSFLSLRSINPLGRSFLRFQFAEFPS